VLIEDSGVTGQPYNMTERDIFEQNADLIDRCGDILAAQPLTRLAIKKTTGKLSITTTGLDRLDVYSQAHPVVPTIHIKRNGDQQVSLPPKLREIEVLGFADEVLRQRRRLRISSGKL
jgi:hypothetical protein